MNTYVVCLIFLGVLGVAHSACPASWSLHAGRCYKVITEENNRATQKTACETAGGYLAEPRSQSVNDFLESMITATSFFGYNDKQTEGTWVGDTSGKEVGYTYWASGEPNNAGSGEQCMEMYNKTGKWNDIFCTEDRQAICETCQTGFTAIGGKCYKVFDTKKTQANAKTACEDIGAFLAEPLSETENGYVKDLITETSFTGFNDKNQENTWVRNTNGESATFLNWASGEPNNFNPGEHCSEMYTISGKWNDIFCTYSRSYVCEA